MVASERRVGKGGGGVNAPIRVQLLLSAVLKAHARKHARTDFEADLNHIKMEYFLLEVRCFFALHHKEYSM